MKIFAKSKMSLIGFICSIATVMLSSAVFAAEESANAGDTAWVLISSALVMLMIPGVALFYGGLVRRKNALSTFMLSFSMLALISLQWILLGYTLSFGRDILGLIGSFEHIALRGIGMQVMPGLSIPTLAYVVFQAMFAIITVALITGSFVERVKFSSFLIFAFLWATFVYSIIAHWVWGGGWLSRLGALDFAGGTVVHISSGISALAFALVIGKRKGFAEIEMEPHSIPMSLIGASLLCFGWFGFNAGSALAANKIAVLAFVNTNTAAASGAFAWLLLSWYHRKPSALGTATGAVAGLVAITPAAGYVMPLSSIVIGALAGIVCYNALIFMKKQSKIDDSLDVFSVHGVGGMFGAIATGVLASVNASGLLQGNIAQLFTQIIAVLATITYAGITTYIIAAAIKRVYGLRVSEEEEEVGLDIAQHGEKAYS